MRPHENDLVMVFRLHVDVRFGECIDGAGHVQSLHAFICNDTDFLNGQLTVPGKKGGELVLIWRLLVFALRPGKAVEESWKIPKPQGRYGPLPPIATKPPMCASFAPRRSHD